MNKTLIALAVAGVMAAPMAAHAAATVYGKIHVSLDYGDTGGDDANPHKASGLFWQSNSSRIGFKGSEDLGGGLKAVWQFESNASFGSGSTSWGGRNSFVGLSGGWGTLVGGKHDTPFKTTGRKFDMFGDQVGDTRNLIRLDRIDASNTSIDDWDQRPDNVIVYKTPKFGGGWDWVLAYVVDEATEDRSALSTSLNWKTGNWFLSLAYEQHDKGWNTDPNDSDGIRFGARWKPGAWDLAAFYQKINKIDGDPDADGDVYGLGAGYKIGKNKLKLQYYMTDNKVTGAQDIDAKLLAVGWDYNFSKRTTAYIAYSKTDNDNNVYYATDRGGHGGEIYGQAVQTGTALGKDPSALSFGMIHKF